MAAAFGIKQADPNTGKFDKASIENYKKLHDMLDADEKNILQQIKDGGLDLDPQKVAEYQAKLEDKIGEQMGLTNQNIPAYTGDANKDFSLVNQIIQLISSNSANKKEMFDRISKWARETNPALTDFEIQSLILTAQSNLTGGK